MKRSKFTAQQIVFALKQAETGVAVAEVWPEAGDQRGDFLQSEEEVRWARTAELRRLRQLERRDFSMKADRGRSCAGQADAAGHVKTKALRAGQLRE